ncbi:GTPase ObgE [Candidatus Daviesbacteria bacterium]|nr:GTPase ObgE [Candidatus Daviesbacteria bacterium]
MLIDEVEITVLGGNGGPGRVSFYPKSGAGPDGGDGGKGGDVYVNSTSDLYALSKFSTKNIWQAQNGQPGGSNRKSGGNGKDLSLEVPIGTLLTDQEGTTVEINHLNQRVLLAKGGLGGRGNHFFKSSSNTTPKYAQPGLKSQVKKLKLKLKLIADIGLIGLPNAGKSSLLNELTKAQARVGDYPFTTLEPNLGVLEGKILADIPGLIEGAWTGKGLGHKFLGHIEKVNLLIHCISSQSPNPLNDYKIIHHELEKFNPKLLGKQEIILLTKSDLVEKTDLDIKIQALSRTKKQILQVSVHNWESLQHLIQVLQNF